MGSVGTNVERPFRQNRGLTYEKRRAGYFDTKIGMKMKRLELSEQSGDCHNTPSIYCGPSRDSEAREIGRHNAHRHSNGPISLGRNGVILGRGSRPHAPSATNQRSMLCVTSAKLLRTVPRVRHNKIGGILVGGGRAMTRSTR